MTNTRSIYLLKRIVAIQEIVIEHQKRGATQTWVYRNVIEPNPLITISKSTFDRYMCINAKKKLKEIEDENKHTVE